MFWTMVKREFLDGVVSLRFLVTSVLAISVMATGAVLFVGDYAERLGDYNRKVNQNLEKIRGSTEDLGKLATTQQSLYKRPSTLSFCASGGEESLPNAISVDVSSTSSEHNVARRNPTLSDFTKLDWTFIVGVIFSFMALLLSYDGISGEREMGTLRLTLSNPVPRVKVMLAKFCGIMMTVCIPLMIGLLVYLLIVVASGKVPLGGGDWARIGIMVLVSLVYVGSFVALGLLVSARTSSSSTSLVVLLFIWVVSAIVIPSSSGLIASGFYKLPSLTEVEQRASTRADAITEEYKGKNVVMNRGNPKAKSNKTWMEWQNAMQQARMDVYREFQRRQFNQTRLARNIAKLSPRAVYTYIMEALAETGFERHIRFLEDAERYREQLARFVREKDQQDPDSAHLYFVDWGLSKRPVDFEEVPVFRESSPSLGESLRQALPDLGILFLFGVAFFMGALASFIRCDVA